MTSPLDGKVSGFGLAADTLQQFISGEPGEIDVGSGTVPTLRKLVVDIKDAATGAVDQQLGDFHAAVEAVSAVADTVIDAQGVVEGLANAWGTQALGIEHTADQRYFSFPSPFTDEGSIVHQRTGATSVEKYRTPTADGVRKPRWAGKKNGWPDQFFKRSVPGVNFLGRKRWLDNGTTPAYPLAVVENSVFPVGKALRRTVQGSANLSGPLIYLDDIGAKVGDTVTVAALIVGTGGNVLLPVSRRNSLLSGVGPQIDGLTDGNASALVTSALPQRMSAEIPITDANVASIWCYPYTTSAGQSFDVVALWAYKGTRAEGLAWPTFSEGPIYEKQIAELATASDAVVGPVAFGFTSLGAVSAANTTIAIEGSLFSTAPRDLPFRGWGEVYNPSGVSFNAIRIKMLTRQAGVAASNRWRTLRVIVRTGATPEAAGAPVVAVGSLTVNESLDTLPADITILLKDPTTGAVKTLSDASFVGGKYFIGVYADNAAGGMAACGEPRGTLPNTAGQSYYTTAVDPVSTGWLVFTSNVRIGFQHLLLTSPVESTTYAPSEALKQALGTAVTTPAPEIILPPTLYAEEGNEFNLFLDNALLEDSKAYSINIDTTGSVGRQLNERLSWVPTAAMAGGTLTYTCYDRRSSAFLAAKTVQLRAVAANAGSGQTINLMEIGDSLINAAVITDELLKRSAASANFKVQLYGTRGTGANKHEGRGGYTIDDYASFGRTYRRFVVTGVVISPSINSAKYSQGATTYTVQEAVLDGSGAGTLVCSIDSGPDTPAASGTLTKTGSTGVGDASITFSATAAQSGNPFYIGGQVNFPQYLTNNAYPAMHAVVISLGINDVFAQVSDATASALADAKFALLDTLIASIKASDPATKVFLRLPSPPTRDQDAFGFNYAAGQTRDRFKRNILIWARQLVAKYAGQEANRVYLMGSNVALDTANDMSIATRTPANAAQSLFFESIGLTAAEVPTAGAVYSVSGKSWAVNAVNQLVTRAAQTLPLDEDATKHVTIPAQYSARIEMQPVAPDSSAPETGTMTKVSGTGGATISYVEVDGGVQSQDNAVHPGNRGYRSLARAEFAQLKYVFSA